MFFGRLAALALTGLALEVVLAFGFVRPLSIWRNPAIVNSDRPLASVLGEHASGAIRFGVPVACAFALFVLAVWLARGLHGRGALATVLGGLVLFSATLLPLNPVAAHDVYHNIADARTVWLHGDNPMVLPPNAFPDDPFYPNVAAWQDFPSVYGPVWYVVSGAPLPFAGSSLWANVVGQKALTALFLLGVAGLVMLIAARIRPGAAVPAGVLVAWNPLLIFETAGNAHNDVVMIFFALAALYAVTRRWWVAVFPLLALSVAAKYILILLGPILLIWMLRRGDVPRRQIVLSLALGAVIGAAVYAPFFAGAATLSSFQRQTGYNTSSPSALLNTMLIARGHLDEIDALKATKLIVLPLYLAAYALLLCRIPRDAGLVALVRTCFWAVFLLFVIATWWFWPWYLVVLAPLAALLPGGRPALIATVFSLCAMLMYVPYFWLLSGSWVTHQTLTAATAFVVPVLVAAAPRIARGRRGHLGALAGD